jgi:hypothetical protein
VAEGGGAPALVYSNDTREPDRLPRRVTTVLGARQPVFGVNPIT